MSSHISHRSKALLGYMKDFKLFTNCGEDGNECALKRFGVGIGEDYGFVVCDNCGLSFLWENYSDAMLSFARYCFMVVALQKNR